MKHIKNLPSGLNLPSIAALSAVAEMKSTKPESVTWTSPLRPLEPVPARVTVPEGTVIERRISGEFDLMELEKD